MLKFGRWNPRYYFAKDFGLESFPHPLYPDKQVEKYPSVTTIATLLDKSAALCPWAANCAVDYIDTYCFNGQRISEDEKYLRDWDEQFKKEARTAYQRISDKAKETGTDIHELCAAWLKGKMDMAAIVETLPENTYQMLLNFTKFCEKHHVKPLAIEQKVYGLGFGGRLDAVWEIDKFWDKENKTDRVIAIPDLKTGKGSYYNDWPIQLAPYRKAHNDNIKYPDGLVTAELAKQLGHATHHGILKFNKENNKVNYKDYSDGYENDYESFLDLMRFWWRNNED